MNGLLALRIRKPFRGRLGSFSLELLDAGLILRGWLTSLDNFRMLAHPLRAVRFEILSTESRAFCRTSTRRSTSLCEERDSC